MIEKTEHYVAYALQRLFGANHPGEKRGFQSLRYEPIAEDTIMFATPIFCELMTLLKEYHAMAKKAVCTAILLGGK